MPVHSIRYRFRQPFRAPASAAFAWCVDFRPSDAALLPHWESRSVEWISDDALILTDTSARRGKSTRIRRLVRIDPSEMSWTNTHLDGPRRHSQFWYRVVRDGPNHSHLEFEGLELVTAARALTPKQITTLAASHRTEDAGMWRREFAPVLEADAKRSRSRRAPRTKGRTARR
ncbi:MAG: hypothetical protein L3K03_02345 [Thermoplasmata archaeon]|nr:hypothetical protein [Thermoplasmata archaeon]